MKRVKLAERQQALSRKMQRGGRYRPRGPQGILRLQQKIRQIDALFALRPKNSARELRLWREIRKGLEALEG